MSEDIAEIAAKLTKAQRDAVYKALVLLDGLAGSGIGQEDQEGNTVWSDDVWLKLYEAFWPERAEACADESLAHLLARENGGAK